MDEVFVIFRIIKVEIGVISLILRLRLITLTKTMIVLDITKLNPIIVLSYVNEKKVVTTAVGTDNLFINV